MSAKDLNTSFENRITLIVHDLAGDHRSRPHPKHQVFQFLARLQSKRFIAVTPSVFFGLQESIAFDVHVVVAGLHIFDLEVAFRVAQRSVRIFFVIGKD
jgi:hypothetical protein